MPPKPIATIAAREVTSKSMGNLDSGLNNRSPSNRVSRDNDMSSDEKLTEMLKLLRNLNQVTAEGVKARNKQHKELLETIKQAQLSVPIDGDGGSVVDPSKRRLMKQGTANMTAKWLAKIAKYRSSTIKDDDEDDPITPACGNAMRAIAGLTPSGAPPLGRETTDDSNDLRLERRTSTDRRQSNDTSCDACGRGADVSRHTTNKRESLADQLQQERDAENLLEHLRKQDSRVTSLVDRQERWEREHPRSANWIVGPLGIVWWDHVIAFLAVVSAFIVPVDVAFSLSRAYDGFFLVSCVMDGFSIVDQLISWRTSFIQDGIVIKEPTVIARRYVRKEFLVDTLCALPLTAILKLEAFEGWAWDVTKLVHVLRMLKAMRVLNDNPRVQDLKHAIGGAVVDLMNIVGALFYLSHLFGCVYICIVRAELETFLTWGWITEADFLSPQAKIDLFAYDWLPPGYIVSKMYPIVTGDFKAFDDALNLWLFAMFWLVCVISGAWVPIPKRPVEAVYGTALVFFGFLVYAAVIAEFTVAWTQLKVAATRESATANELDQSLQMCKIPTQLRKHVLQFNDFAASEAQNVIEHMDMPGSLRLQLDMVNNRNLFLKVPFFKNCDLGQIMMLVQLIKREYVWPGKTVLNENSVTRGLFMVNRGFCKLSMRGEDRELLTYPDFFGDDGLITGALSKMTSTTITLCEFMVLTANRFEAFVEQFAKVRKNVEKYQAAKHKDNYKARVKLQLAKAKVELQQCWQKLNHTARSEVVSLIQQLESRTNQMGQGAQLLNMVKQKTMGNLCKKNRRSSQSPGKEIRKLSNTLMANKRTHPATVSFPHIDAPAASEETNAAAAAGDVEKGKAEAASAWATPEASVDSIQEEPAGAPDSNGLSPAVGELSVDVPAGGADADAAVVEASPLTSSADAYSSPVMAAGNELVGAGTPAMAPDDLEVAEVRSVGTPQEQEASP